MSIYVLNSKSGVPTDIFLIPFASLANCVLNPHCGVPTDLFLIPVVISKISGMNGITFSKALSNRAVWNSCDDLCAEL